MKMVNPTAMNCPKCNLFNPSEALRCDCGYSFIGGAPPLSEQTTTNEKNWAIAAHLSCFLSLAFPYAGLLGPLIIYLLKKDESLFIAKSAKAALNFWLTQLVLAIPAFIIWLGSVIVTAGGVNSPSLLKDFSSFAFVFSFYLGFLMIVGWAGMVFAILAAMSANKGRTYRYPISISFLK